MNWINVDNMEPEWGQVVLVYWHGFVQKTLAVFCRDGFFYGYDPHEDDECGEPFGLDAPTHWMYLPEPPK